MPDFVTDSYPLFLLAATADLQDFRVTNPVSTHFSFSEVNKCKTAKSKDPSHKNNSSSLQPC